MKSRAARSWLPARICRSGCIPKREYSYIDSIPGPKSIAPSRSAGRTGKRRSSSVCIPPVSTGDVLDSLKCDCGTQLALALDHMSHAGGGILLYMNQEGRGIGLGNKVRAYSLQDQGFDTLEANHRLGFEGDERDFGIAADILKHLGFASAQLMTNNPEKVRMMEAAGIEISGRIPLKSEPTEFNEAYLAAKSEKFGHLL